MDSDTSLERASAPAAPLAHVSKMRRPPAFPIVSERGRRNFNEFFDVLFQNLHYFRNYLDYFEGRIPAEQLRAHMLARTMMEQREATISHDRATKMQAVRLIIAEKYASTAEEINQRLTELGFPEKVSADVLKRIREEMGVSTQRGSAPRLTSFRRFRAALKALDMPLPAGMADLARQMDAEDAAVRAAPAPARASAPVIEAEVIDEDTEDPEDLPDVAEATRGSGWLTPSRRDAIRTVAKMAKALGLASVTVRRDGHIELVAHVQVDAT